MKRSLFDISNSIFYEIAQSTVNEINFRSSEKVEFPIIEKTPKCRVIVPKPRKVNETYFFEGCVFENYDNDYKTIWSLYLASVSHMAAHAKVSDYTKYENWIKGKTSEKCQKVIDFVEDVRVEEYLKKSFPETWQHITSIKNTFDDLENSKASKSSNEKFSNLFCAKKSNKILKLREKLSQCNEFEVDDIISYLDFLYKNQRLLPKSNLPYCMHRDDGFPKNSYMKNVKIQPHGKFARIVSDIDDVWVKEKRNHDKKLSEYQNMVKNSHFDEVLMGSENLAEYTRLADESENVLKKLQKSFMAITDVVDTPEDAGLLNLQSAIQREAGENKDMQIFDQDNVIKESENWFVIIDASASMVPKFEEMKKIVLCLSEVAERVNKRKGKWGLYGFNNNFLVVKDHIEKYDKQAMARIGGIENKGLSLIPDAVDVGLKILKKDEESTRKYLILVSDGMAFGYDGVGDCFKKSLLKARQCGIQVIGIGIPKSFSKYFSIIINGDDLEKSMSDFLGGYTYLTKTTK